MLYGKYSLRWQLVTARHLKQNHPAFERLECFAFLERDLQRHIQVYAGKHKERPSGYRALLQLISLYLSLLLK